MKILAKYEYPTGRKGEIIGIFADEEGRDRFKKIEEDEEGNKEEMTCPIENFFRFFNFKFTELSPEFHNFLNCYVANCQIDIRNLKQTIKDDRELIKTLFEMRELIKTLFEMIQNNEIRIKMLKIVSKRINEKIEVEYLKDMQKFEEVK